MQEVAVIPSKDPTVSPTLIRRSTRRLHPQGGVLLSSEPPEQRAAKILKRPSTALGAISFSRLRFRRFGVAYLFAVADAHVSVLCGTPCQASVGPPVGRR